jgi:hypothetical protein
MQAGFIATAGAAQHHLQHTCVFVARFAERSMKRLMGILPRRLHVK